MSVGPEAASVDADCVWTCAAEEFRQYLWPNQRMSVSNVVTQRFHLRIVEVTQFGCQHRKTCVEPLGQKLLQVIGGAGVNLD